MANIVSPKRGRWLVRWRDESGKRRSSGWFTDKGEAADFQKQKTAEERASRSIAAGKVLSLAELTESFLRTSKEEGRSKVGHQEKTRAVLVALFKARKWFRLADLRVGQIGKLKVGEHRALKSIMFHAARLGQPLDAGLLHLRPPKRVRKPQRDLLTPAQVATLVDAASEWCHSNGAIAHLLSTYGHRPETAVQIRLRDVDLERGIIDLEVKGGDKVRHPLLPATLDWLRPLWTDSKGRERPADAFLFLSHNGEPWGTGKRLAEWWWHYLGGRVMPSHRGIYELKRGAISSMLDRGLPLKVICSITGHRTPATLHLYARTNDERQREAIAGLAEIHAGRISAVPRDCSLIG